MRRLFYWFHFILKKVFWEGSVAEVTNKDKTKAMLKLSIVKTKHTTWMDYAHEWTISQLLDIFFLFLIFYSYFGFHIFLSLLSIYLLQLTYKVRSARVWRLADCLGWRPRGVGLCRGRSCWRGWRDLRIALLWGPCGTTHIFVVDRNIISILNMKHFYTFIRLIFRST